MADKSQKFLYQYSATMVSDWWKVGPGSCLNMFFGDDCREDPYVVTGLNAKTGEVWIARRGAVTRIVADRPEELEGCDLRWMTEAQEKAERPSNRVKAIANV